MASKTGWSLFGATAGAGCAWVLVLCGRAGAAPVVLLAGTTGGAVIAVVAARTAGRPLSPVGDEARTTPEVEKVSQAGYEIGFQQAAPSKRFTGYAFVARRGGQWAGRLDVHFIEAEKRLYVDNVYVAGPHGNRGLATALLLAAAKTMRCAVVTTSGRTKQGAAFFARSRPVLKRHGVELRDDPP